MADYVVGHFNEDGIFIPSGTGTQPKSDPWDGRINTYGDNQSSNQFTTNAYAGDNRKQSSRTRDNNWVRRGLLNIRKTSRELTAGRTSPAKRAYTDTTLGGDIAINPQYQYTRFADIKARQIIEVGQGIGRFYYEQIWQNRHDIHIRFGFQTFTSGFTFFSRWYDYTADRLSRTGRAPGWLFTIGKVAGYYIAWINPSYALSTNLIRFAMAYGGQSRYCYVKSGMGAYWGTVNNLVNAVASNMSLTLPTSEDAQFESLNQKFDPEKPGNNITGEAPRAAYMREYMKLLPSIYEKSSDGGWTIDMVKIATRAQRLHNMSSILLRNRIEAISSAEGVRGKQFEQWLEENIDSEYIHIINSTGTLKEIKWDPLPDGEKWSFTGLVKTMWSKVAGYMTSSNENGKSTDLKDSEKDNKTKSTDIQPAESIRGFWGRGTSGEPDQSLVELMRAESQNGADWISFRVNGTKSVSESFSNSATESEIAGTFNNFAKARQKMTFNFAGGSMFGDTVKGVINTIMDGAMGVLNGMGLGGLGGVLTGAQIDIPKQWDSSSVNFPKLSYELNLRTPYGHPLAVFQALVVPTLCLVAGTLPISRGRNAFGSPFYCEVYDKGAWQVKMGCIQSLNITRGVGNVPWSRDRLPLGIDVSFDILDMSTVMSVPIMSKAGVTDIVDDVLTPGKLADDLSLGSDTPIDDYLFALSGMGLQEQLYNSNRMSRNWGKWFRKVSTAFSTEAFVHDFMNHTPSAVLQLFSSGTMRR